MRLDGYDYSQAGLYYVTICLEQMKHDYFARIIDSADENGNIHTISKLTANGKVALEQLFALEERYSFVKIKEYVIMPDHIHFVIQFLAQQTEKKVTLNDVVCAYKSLTTKALNQTEEKKGRKVFHRSYYDHIILGQHDYDRIRQYIQDNPINWRTHKSLADYQEEQSLWVGKNKI